MTEIPPAPVQGPVTPRKPRDNPVEGYIHALNQDYGLSTQLPDPSQSPVRRKERAARDKTFARWDQICQGLHHLHYRRDGSIEKVNRAFFYEAKARSQHWPPPQNRDLVTSGDFPRAVTPAQQRELEQLLVDVIAQVKSTPQRHGNGPVVVPRADEFRGSTAIAVGDFAQDAATNPAEVSPPARTKRPPHDWYESSSKRPRSRGLHPDDDGEPAGVYHALDNTPSRQRQGMPERRESPIPFRAGDFIPVAADRASSFNTSKQSIVPTLFSERTASTVQTSQSTLELSSQERKETLQQFFTSTSDDYPPSSGEIRALHESFTANESRSAETTGLDLGVHTPVAPVADKSPRNETSPRVEKSLQVEKSLHTAEPMKDMQGSVVRIEPVKPDSVISAHLDGIWRKYLVLQVAGGIPLRPLILQSLIADPSPQPSFLHGFGASPLPLHGRLLAFFFTVMLTWLIPIWTIDLNGPPVQTSPSCGRVLPCFLCFKGKHSQSAQVPKPGRQRSAISPPGEMSRSYRSRWTSAASPTDHCSTSVCIP